MGVMEKSMDAFYKNRCAEKSSAYNELYEKGRTECLEMKRKGVVMEMEGFARGQAEGRERRVQQDKVVKYLKIEQKR